VFPRQGHGKYLCISDFFRSIESGEQDVCAFQIVTIGEKASRTTGALFDQDKYQDYLYLHGLSVEATEALAEYWHKTVRIELGIADADARDIDRLFSQGYKGSRYSFGYPACPNLEDHEPLFRILNPERIGISLTEEFQLVPEQSTSAIIVHHPEAKYFNVR
jgi:5-methyltetrahydrofolate--homocysteine methyltransferase